MKTPEEMAEEYLEQDEIACDAINHAAEHLVKAGFLAGYHTAYNLAYELGFESALKTQKIIKFFEQRVEKENENT